MDIARLANTEYTNLVDPTFATETEFGLFCSHPHFPGCRDANQLCRCHCAPHELERLLQRLEELYAPTDLTYRKLSGHDAATHHHLHEALPARGWSAKGGWMMTFDRPPQRSSNPAITVRALDAAAPNPTLLRDLDGLHRVGSRLNRGYAFQRAQDARVGGQWLIAYLRGEPVASTGWFVADGIARFRAVNTLPWARGEGAATTLIRHVQEHPVVRAQDTLTIFCGEDGPRPLYEQLGFVTRGFLWEFLLRRAA